MGISSGRGIQSGGASEMLTVELDGSLHCNFSYICIYTYTYTHMYIHMQRSTYIHIHTYVSL